MPDLDSVSMVSVLDSVSTLFVQASVCEHGMCSGLCECYVSRVSMVNVLDSWCSDFVSRTLHHGMFVSWTLHTGHVCLQDSAHMAVCVSRTLHTWHVCLLGSARIACLSPGFCMHGMCVSRTLWSVSILL